MTTPTLTKTTAILITILGIALALEISNITHMLTHPMQNSPFNFSSSVGDFNPLTHWLSSMNLLFTGQMIASHLIDLSWYKKMGPEVLADLQLMATKTSTNPHTGLIKTYLESFVLSILIIILSLH